MAFKDSGHWHIEGWCVLRQDRAIKNAHVKFTRWRAESGGCQVIGRIEQGSRQMWAASLTAMRDRIREGGA